MENKLTAVEWLYAKMKYTGAPSEELLVEAKKMEMDQMMEFARGFWYYANGADAPPCYKEDVEKYYHKVNKNNNGKS